MQFKQIAGLLAAVALAACHSEAPMHGGGPDRTTAPVGVILGGILANDPGRSLDQADLDFMQQKTTRALESAPTNQPLTWQNPVSQYQVQATPTRTWQQPNGAYCRDYTQTITAKAQIQTARGTACRQSDGSWQAAG
jgi:surface antigen